eukprot:533111_1
MRSKLNAPKLASFTNAKQYGRLQPLLAPLPLIPYGHQNFIYPGCDPEKMKILRDTFKTRDNDILLNSYPKSGNHFLKKCVIEIVRTTDKENTHPLYTSGDIGQETVPHIEFQYSQLTKSQFNDRLKYTSNINPCFWWFHQTVLDISCKDFKIVRNIPNITEKVAEKFLLKMKGKIIIIVRNPKDVIVSGYYFWRAFATNIEIESMPYTFSDYISYFYRGLLQSGCYFEFMQQWWILYKICNKVMSGSVDGYNDKILWVYYEDLIDEPKPILQKIAKFIGNDKQLNSKEFDVICEAIKFENAKTMIMEDSQSFEIGISLMRSGTNNNWQELMSENDSMRVDEMMYFKWAQYCKDIRYYQELMQNHKLKKCDAGYHNKDLKL